MTYRGLSKKIESGFSKRLRYWQKGGEKKLDIKKLKGVENCYRLRSGKYRVLYQKRRKEIIIILISVRH